MSDDRLLVIVEDDVSFARTLKRSFERRDYRVLYAASFEELSQLLTAHKPHYAVVDLKLGGASGSPASSCCMRMIRPCSSWS